MKIALDEWCFHNSFMTRQMGMEDFFERAGEIGVQGVGFDYFMLPKELQKAPEDLKGLLEQNGLEVVFGFGIPFAVPGVALDFLENQRDEMFDIADVIGAKVVRVCGGMIVPNMLGKPIHLNVRRKKEVEKVARRLKRFAADAELEGITVAVENHSEYKADEMLEILDRAEADNLKVTLDTGNAMYLGEDPVETVEKLGPHTVYTHIKDLKKQGPLTLGAALGEGDIDVPAVIGALKASGYDGLYSIEVDLPLWKVNDEVDAATRSVDYLRSLD